MCDLCRSPYIQNTRIFPENLRRDIRARAVSNFDPEGAMILIAATKLAQQTNNKRTKNKDAPLREINASCC